MFIIEPSNYESFSSVFLKIQGDIDIINNLIFTNDDYLWSDSAYDFVQRSDPDIILNLSSLDDEKLAAHFRKMTVKPFTDQYKIERFCTQLIDFQNKPTIFDTFEVDINEEISVFSASKMENTPESLFCCINYGFAEGDFLEHLELSIFKNLKINKITALNNAIKNIFSDDKFINFLTHIIDFTTEGYGHSVYDIEYNASNIFFDKKNYLFISQYNDFKSISYFWNTRSYYTNSKLAWVPDVLLSKTKPIVNTNTVFVCFDTTISQKIKKLYPSNALLQPERLYFHTRNNRWRFFENTQVVNIVNNEVKINHPYEKSFGSIGAFVFEIRGLKEFLLPQFRKIGNLFSVHHLGFEERFHRISSVGLANYYLAFEPYHQLVRDDFFDTIYLPKFSEVIDCIFSEVNLKYLKTQKTSILNQTLNMFGELEDLYILSDRTLFNLLSTLTPMIRTEKIIKKLVSSDDHKREEFTKKISEMHDEGGIEIPNVIHTLDDIISIAKVKKENKEKYIAMLQNIYSKNILIRGKYFDCPFCSSKIWVQLSSLKRKNRCPECNNKIDVPITGQDYYKLNHLIVRAIDQGQLTTLVLLYFLYKQNYYFDFISNINVVKNGKTITDIDLFVKLGRRIGIIESKSMNGFEEKQIDDLLDIAVTLKCDFIGFSTFLNSDDQKVKDTIAYIEKKSCKMPIFIFTGDILFNPEKDKISPFFESSHFGNKYPTGPLLISKLPSNHFLHKNLENIFTNQL
jgi:DNA-directed RNA polymerase subunit RPC12/RpoP